MKQTRLEFTTNVHAWLNGYSVSLIIFFTIGGVIRWPKDKQRSCGLQITMRRF